MSDEHLLQIRLCHPVTYLSPNVFHILCEIESSEESCLCLECDGVIDWDSLETFLPASQDSVSYYEDTVKLLFPLFQSIHKFYRLITDEEFKLKFGRCQKWISQHSMLVRCLDLLRSGGETSALHTVLILSSLLERSLGDVVLLKASQCPSLLRDLLLMPELEEILSPVVVRFLRVLIGPPISLNLRNVCWHGFPNVDEIKPCYSYVLLCTVISIGHLLEERNLIDHIVHRKFLSISVVKVFPDFVTSNNDVIHRVFDEINERIPKRKSLWFLALQLFMEQRYGECLVILLPQLEHLLRCIFVAASNCSDRLYTAENSVTFTTFDEIFSVYINESTENRFRIVVGDSYLSLLLDFFVYPAGPRLRDRISHGEFRLRDVTRDAAEVVIYISTAIAIRFLPSDHELFQVQKLFPEIHSSFKCQTYLTDHSFTHSYHLFITSCTPTTMCSEPNGGNNKVYTARDAQLSLKIPSHLCFETKGERFCKMFHEQDRSSSTRTGDRVRRISSKLLTPFLLHWNFEDSYSALKIRERTDEENDVGHSRVVLLKDEASDALKSFAICIGADQPGEPNQLFEMLDIRVSIGDQTEEFLDNLSINTIFRYQRVELDPEKSRSQEKEIVAAFIKVVSSLTSTSRQIQDVVTSRSELMKRKELRSRQRMTYCRMLDALGPISQMFRLVLLEAALYLFNLEHFTVNNQIKLVRYLKHVQKFADNLSIYTKPDNNKWEESSSICQTLLSMTKSLKGSTGLKAMNIKNT